MVIGDEIERVIDRRYPLVLSIESGDQRLDRCIRVTQILDKDLSLRFAAFPVLDDQITTVIGDLGSETPLRMIRSLEISRSWL